MDFLRCVECICATTEKQRAAYALRSKEKKRNFRNIVKLLMHLQLLECEHGDSVLSFSFEHQFSVLEQSILTGRERERFFLFILTIMLKCEVIQQFMYIHFIYCISLFSFQRDTYIHMHVYRDTVRK